MRMTDVPLFPLGTVLFPQMILPLRIFEQRYRIMISECLKNNMPFGVILLQEGDEVQELPGSQPARPHPVGTLARITEVAKSPDGTYELFTIGTERFRLMEYRSDKAYMTGDIEIWPDETQSSTQLNAEVSQVRTAFQDYLKVLMELAGKKVELEIPTEPDALSFLVPNWLHVGMSDKQKLLEAPGAYERLQAERQLLMMETDFLEKIKEKADQEGYPTDDQEGGSPLNQTRPGYDISSRFSKN